MLPLSQHAHSSYNEAMAIFVGLVFSFFFAEEFEKTRGACTLATVPCVQVLVVFFLQAHVIPLPNVYIQYFATFSFFLSQLSLLADAFLEKMCCVRRPTTCGTRLNVKSPIHIPPKNRMKKQGEIYT